MKVAGIQAESCEAAYPHELVVFAAGARAQGLPAPAVRDGHDAMRVAVAATMSYRGRRRVGMPEIQGRTKSGVA